MKCQQEQNLADCPCTWADCPRKGICCECIRYHWQREKLPACFFSKETEKTYDRSIKRFIEEQNKN